MEKEKINNIGYSIVDLENINWDEFCVLYDYFDTPNEKDIGMIINRYGSLRRILTIKNANVSQAFFGIDDIGFDYTVFQRMFLENGISSNVDLSNFNLNSYLLGLMLNPSDFNTLVDLRDTYSDHWMNFENDKNSITPLKYENFININNKVYEIDWYDLLFNVNGMTFIQNESLYEYEDKIFGLSVNPSTMDILPNLWESYSDHWMEYSRNNFPYYQDINSLDILNSKLMHNNYILEDNPNHWMRNYTINDSFPILFEVNQTLKTYFNEEIIINLFKEDYILEDNPNHWMRNYTINDSFPILFNNDIMLDEYFSEEKYIEIFKQDYILEDNPNHWSKQYSIFDNWLDIFDNNQTLTPDRYTTNVSI